MGRDAEQAQLSEVLDVRAELVAALVTGPAGIGKTALWEWTLERAAGQGYLVLVSRAGVAEVQLPWVGLTDLLRAVDSSALAGLPPPQRQALQVAMLQSDHGEPVDERAVGTALWSVLQAQSHSGPVLIAVDERARHAALAATNPDPRIARALDVGVLAALAAGAPDIAVELSWLALQHTESEAERAGRLDLLADALVRAGDSPGAVQAQRQAIALTPAAASEAPARARRRIRLAEMATEVIGWGAAADELQIAVAEAAADPAARSEALLTLAAVSDDIDLADASATEAVALLTRAGQPDPAAIPAAGCRTVRTRATRRC